VKSKELAKKMVSGEEFKKEEVKKVEEPQSEP